MLLPQYWTAMNEVLHTHMLSTVQLYEGSFEGSRYLAIDYCRKVELTSQVHALVY